MITATELRGNLYQLLDQVLATGEPLEIKRHGQVLKIIPEQAPLKKSKLAKLKKHQGVINCNPEELIHQDWLAEWSETKK
ncbi:MAG: hypothetical protein K0Q57_1059 [Gammaproteobacteria bacterium]|jgi:antitoxin (DNA-binding transcriptional repressor) of toxin-antitoxin stability system|nr:hypothetical protein [Gammaproteobacteria bacterium]